MFGAALALAARAQIAPGDVAPHARFFLPDGSSFDAFAPSDAKAVVVVWFHTACPVARASLPEVEAIAREFAAKGARIVVVDAHDEPPADVVAFAKERVPSATLAFDRDASVGRSFGVERVPTAIVVDAARRLRYRGRIFERYTGRDEGAPTIGRLDLRLALVSTIEGRPIDAPETYAAGCRLPAPATREVSTPYAYHRDVAPILARRCADCHRRGGSAPMPFESFRDVRPYAVDVAEVAFDGMMPPWREDGHGVELLGARRLAPTERSILVRWAQGGAPEGEPVDEAPPEAPTSRKAPSDEASTYVLVVKAPTAPKFAAPYLETIEVVFEGAEDVLWRRVEARADAEDVVRRLVVRRARDQALLTARTPEGPVFEAPSGSAWRFSRGESLTIEAYVRPQGVVRTPSIELRFHAASGVAAGAPEPTTIVLKNEEGVVEAGTSGETRIVERTFEREVRVAAMFADLGRPGASVQIEATTPDAKTRRLAGTMHWDPRMQDVWIPARPCVLPAGTKVRLIAVYDDSPTARRRSLGPPRDIPFGPALDDARCRLDLVVVPP